MKDDSSWCWCNQVVFLSCLGVAISDCVNPSIYSLHHYHCVDESTSIARGDNRDIRLHNELRIINYYQSLLT